jgi:peptide/nickel transport system ATP-binding protein
VVFDGEELGVKRDSGTRRRAQMVFQDPNSSLNPAQTVERALSELIRFHALVPRRSVRSRCVELLRMVELPPSILRAYPRQMSGGQRQRVAIARALAVEPDLLIADEAVAALDVSVQASVLRLLMRLRRELGLTMILISHDLAVVRHACDRVAVMYLGRIVEVGGTDALFSDPRHPYTRALLRAVPRIGERRQTPALRGELPSSLAVPPGCRFHPRCPIAEFPVCSEVEPPLEGFAGHVAACHFAWRDPDRAALRAASEPR